LQIERDTSVDSRLKVRFYRAGRADMRPGHVPVEFIADMIEGGKITRQSFVKPA